MIEETNPEVESLVKRRPQSFLNIEEPDAYDEEKTPCTTKANKATTAPRRLSSGSRTKSAKFYLVLLGLIMGTAYVFRPQFFRLWCDCDTVKSNSKQTFKTAAFVVDIPPASPSYFDSDKLLQPLILNDDSLHSYNGLNFQSLAYTEDFQRKISSRDEELYERQRVAELNYMEKHDLHSRERYDPFDDLDFPRKCIRPQWTWNMFPTCMNVHAFAYDRSPENLLQNYDLKYLGHGAFREAVRFTPTDGTTPFVIKSKIYKNDFDRKEMHQINTEALIFERLSASKLTSDIYAHCGSSVVVQSGHDIEKSVVPRIGRNERGRLPQEMLDALEVNDVHPMNNYSVSEKVDMALVMAESLAEMHGYIGGVMVNDDIDFGQWLVLDDGSLVLNDFNNAMYMEWNLEKQEYCKYFRGFQSTFKAPEEIEGDYLDESVDIWPMGNLIFGILTGLFPFHEISDHSEIRNRTKEGPPYIDPRYRTRSYAEGRLVEIMDKCYKMNATDRVDIFEVVQHLRETKLVMSQQ